MKKLLSLSLCLLLFSCGNENSDKVSINDFNQHLVTDLNSFYLDRLNAHQFLLLGESKHNDHVLNNAVIDFLNYWLTNIEKDEDVPQNMTLVLEYTQSFGKQLQEFFNTEDVSHLGMEIQGRTLNTLEFFYDLKNVYHRANRMKEHSNLVFEIFCPELDIPFDLPREGHKQIAKTERDNNTTRNMLNYIEHGKFKNFRTPFH